MALFGEEKPYDTLTASKLGSYWCLLSPYVLGSGIFAGTPRERWIIDTYHARGGVTMGMIRFHQHSGLFANENGVDDCYSLRYVMALLGRDEVDRALVSFYGKLAQGLTRDTFIGGEGTSLVPLDEFGRPMYLPPNATGNAYFLWTLRNLLVQDGDCDENGRPATLRLLFATPRPGWPMARRFGASVPRRPSAKSPSSPARGSIATKSRLTFPLRPVRRSNRCSVSARRAAGGSSLPRRRTPAEARCSRHGRYHRLARRFTLRFEVKKGQ